MHKEYSCDGVKALIIDYIAYFISVNNIRL